MSGQALRPVSTEPDPYLASLFVRDGFFDLGGKTIPGSIRDQIIRAKTFVELAQLRGFLTNERNRVLVIGAGVAGVTVALLASRIKDTFVTLVDSSPAVLAVQRGNDQRFISPSAYDWPARHSQATLFAGDLPDYPEGTPSQFARLWSEHLRNHRSAALTTIQGAVRKIDKTCAHPPWHVEIACGEPDRPLELQFDLVVACRGAGKEKTIPVRLERGTAQLDGFPAWEFWEVDPYPSHERPIQLSPSRTVESMWREHWPVVIIGGGDGAIQDALRFITGGKSIRTILDRLHRKLGFNALAEYHDLQSMEDVAQRASAAIPESLDSLNRHSHRLQQRLIDYLYESPDRAHGLDQEMTGLTAFNGVQIFYPNETLGPCYALNRFLALLFNRHFLRRKGRSLLRPLHIAQHVVCKHSDGARDKFACYNRPHEVFFESRDGKPRLISCQVVVPRIGVASEPATCDRIQKSVSHCLPQFLPAWGPPLDWRSNSKDDLALLQLLWRSLPGTAVIKDLDGRLRFCNPFFEQMTGRRQETVTGLLPSDYWEPEAGRLMSKGDRLVRDEREPTLTSEWLRLGEFQKRRYTWRFPMFGQRGELTGIATLGLDLHEQFMVTLPAERNRMDPPMEDLTNFFRALPCSILVRDFEGKSLYGHGSDTAPESWMRDDPRPRCSLEPSPTGERYVIRFGVFQDQARLSAAASIAFSKKEIEDCVEGTP